MSEKTRIDRNVVENLLDLRQFGEDSSIIKCVLFYLAFNHQDHTHLFNNSTLDVDDFCKKFNFHRENLIAKHPNPKYTLAAGTARKRLSNVENISSDIIQRPFESVIENALYRLYTENMVFHGKARRYVSENGDKNEVLPLTRIIFLQNLSIRHIITKSGRKKIVYDYELHEDFKKNLSLYFASIEISLVAKLRQAKADDLYIYLRGLKETLAASQSNETSSVSFDHLCEIANIAESLTNKARKQKLIKKFQILKEKINFPVELSFTISKGHRWAYTPVIKFPKIIVVKEQEKVELRRDILLHNFMLELTSIIKELYPEREVLSDDFHLDIIRFCKHKDNFKEKQAAYINAQKNSFITPNPKCLKNAIHIPQRLLEVQTIDDIKKIITEIPDR